MEQFLYQAILSGNILEECESGELKILSGSPLDTLLDGGVGTRSITHLYGCAGSGKTTFALQVSIAAARLGWDVLYFDTEGSFPVQRLFQMTEIEQDMHALSRVTVCQPAFFEEQHTDVLKLSKEGGKPWGLTNLKVVVMDTITKLYRDEAAQSQRTRLFRKLADYQVPLILRAARQFDLAILLLSQVSADLSGYREIKPVAGDAVSRAAKFEIELRIDETMDHIGTAKIIKPRSLGLTGKVASYRINSRGLTQL